MNTSFIKYLLAAFCTLLLCSCGTTAPALPHGARIPINANTHSKEQSESSETSLVFGEDRKPVTDTEKEPVKSGTH